jgi:hypothetical protein
VTDAQVHQGPDGAGSSTRKGCARARNLGTLPPRTRFSIAPSQPALVGRRKGPPHGEEGCAWCGPHPQWLGPPARYLAGWIWTLPPSRLPLASNTTTEVTGSVTTISK